jgi:hypothetical protein
MVNTVWQNSQSQEADSLWLKIVQQHREARTLARCGEEEQAKALLRDTLPPLIRAWSHRSGLPRNLQILRLRKLLRGNIRTILESQSSTPQRKAASQKAQRIPLRDISRMIDFVRISEAQTLSQAIAS